MLTLPKIFHFRRISSYQGVVLDRLVAKGHGAVALVITGNAKPALNLSVSGGSQNQESVQTTTDPQGMGHHGPIEQGR